MKLLRLSAILLSFVFAASISSCNNDKDEKEKNYPNAIVGTWTLEYVSGWDIEDGVKDEWTENMSEEDYDTMLKFNNDGSGAMWDTDEDYETKFTWTISGSVLTMKASSETIRYTIESMSSSQLILSASGTDWYERAVFKK